MPETDTSESDLALLERAARAAGKVALSFHGPDAKAWEKPGQGPVTEADYAVNDVLEDILRRARPAYGWLSEETPDTEARLACEYIFIVDPIDGTRSFIEGSGTWAHSIAIARSGAITAAVVHLPALSRCFSAVPGGGAALNGTPIKTGTRSTLAGATLMAPKPSMQPQHWKGGPPDVNRVFRPSLAYRMALIAQGRFDAMLTLRPAWHWDIAAGALIAQEAGALATTANGTALAFNTETPKSPGVVVANPGLHAELMAKLKS